MAFTDAFWRCTLPAFSGRFRDEMLSIFDEPAGPPARTLLWGAVVSLLRQWLVRMGGWKVAIAVGVAFLQFWGFGLRKGFFSPGENRQVCGLCVFIMSLIVWTLRFQRERSGVGGFGG